MSFHRDALREYLQCVRCELVFVPAEYHLSLAAERAEYDKHENAVDDPGYRQFLSRLAEPLLSRLAPGRVGLDFGCGPAPALAQLLEAAGHSVALYDPFFMPDEHVMNGRYDFICATEVVEHLRQPGSELKRLWGLLKVGGRLGLMTKLVRDVRAFAGWHYIRDPTHISFFSRASFAWWAHEHSAALELLGADVIILQKIDESQR